MSLYHMHLNSTPTTPIRVGLVNPHDYNVDAKNTQVFAWQMIADMMRESSHQLLFIITKAQQPKWDEAMEKYPAVKEFISYEGKDYIHNPNYPNEGRKLKVIVLTGKGTEV